MISDLKQPPPLRRTWTARSGAMCRTCSGKTASSFGRTTRGCEGPRLAEATTHLPSVSSRWLSLVASASYHASARLVALTFHGANAWHMHIIAKHETAFENPMSGQRINRGISCALGALPGHQNLLLALHQNL